MNFLGSPYARALTALLVLQTAVYYAADLRNENTPNPAPLDSFPLAVNGWQTVHQQRIEKEVQEVLRADDTLNRVYVAPDGRSQASLFIAFFKTQRTGQTPHSPKNCLPGSGWEPSATGVVQLDAGGSPISINHYLVSRGEEKSVVLYWYQSHNRVIASELAAKFWLIVDAIRYNRSDTALVRVVVPVRGHDEAGALSTASTFVKDVFPSVRRQLPM